MDLPLTPANFLDSLYADDILRAIKHPNLDVLVRASHASATAYEEALGELGLATTVLKSENFLMDEANGADGLFRRNADDPLQSTNQTHQNPAEAQLHSLECHNTDEKEDNPENKERPTPTETQPALPYSEVSRMKVCG